MTLTAQPRIQGRHDFQTVVAEPAACIYLGTIRIAPDEIDAYLEVLAAVLKQEAAKLNSAASASPKERP